MLENLLKARKCQKIARKSKNARKSIRGLNYPQQKLQFPENSENARNSEKCQKFLKMLEILENARNS